ncbi:MAG TPA: hypothetical protein VF590_20920, partial [Isosphaeraceae bacterium]
ERQDVADPLGGTGLQLPMPRDTPNYSGTAFLQGECRLVTLFARTGLITTTILRKSRPDPQPMNANFVSPTGFDGANVDLPFLDAQLGRKDTP